MIYLNANILISSSLWKYNYKVKSIGSVLSLLWKYNYFVNILNDDAAIMPVKNILSLIMPLENIIFMQLLLCSYLIINMLKHQNIT